MKFLKLLLGLFRHRTEAPPSGPVLHTHLLADLRHVDWPTAHTMRRLAEKTETADDPYVRSPSDQRHDKDADIDLRWKGIVCIIRQLRPPEWGVPISQTLRVDVVDCANQPDDFREWDVYRNGGAG